MKPISIEQAIDGRARLRLGPLAPRLRNLAAALVLIGVLVLLAIISLGQGSTPLSLADILAALIGHGSEDAEFAVWYVRLPRILLGFVAGFSLAMTGAILQTLARNPLADPSLLGLSQGAVVAAMLIAVFLPQTGLIWRGVGATGGALVTGLVLMALVGSARAAGLSIILMGIAVETTLSAVSAMLIVHSPPEVSYQLAQWMAGSLERAAWPVLAGYLPFAVLVIPMLIFAGPTLRAYELGDDLARAIGAPTGTRRAAILMVTVVIAGATTAAVGPLMFLGVMGPHLARFLSPATGAARLSLSGLMGAVLVLGADITLRLLGALFPLPFGLCLVLIGVPLFIISLRLGATRRA